MRPAPLQLPRVIWRSSNGAGAMGATKPVGPGLLCSGSLASLRNNAFGVLMVWRFWFRFLHPAS